MCPCVCVGVCVYERLTVPPGRCQVCTYLLVQSSPHDPHNDEVKESATGADRVSHCPSNHWPLPFPVPRIPRDATSSNRARSASANLLGEVHSCTMPPSQRHMPHPALTVGRARQVRSGAGRTSTEDSARAQVRRAGGAAVWWQRVKQVCVTRDASYASSSVMVTTPLPLDMRVGELTLKPQILSTTVLFSASVGRTRPVVSRMVCHCVLQVSEDGVSSGASGRMDDQGERSKGQEPIEQ